MHGTEDRSAVRPTHDARFMVGESLVWSEADEALYFVDIVGRSISAYRPQDGSLVTWPTPEWATSIGLCRGGRFIVGLERRVCLWRPGGAFDTVAVPEPDLPGNRLNEGAVAPDGSYWVSTMQTNLERDGSPRPQTAASGAYYRIAPDFSVSRLTPAEYGITNTMVWLPDGRFVTADTTANALYTFTAPRSDGLGERSIFHAGLSRGLPDGSTLDSEGYIWNCRVAGGSALARFDPNGRLDRIVELPCSWPTSCAFGGSLLGTLFVSSARFTMSAEHLAANPQEGALFALDVGVRGIAPNHFG